MDAARKPAWKRGLHSLVHSSNPLWLLARIGILVYIGSLVLMMLFENKLIFFPSRYPQGDWNIATRSGEDGRVVGVIEDVNLTDADGVAIHGWFCVPHRIQDGTPVPVDADMTLLIFHGNAGNLSDRRHLIEHLLQLNANILMCDYPGYGRSEGSPTEAGLYRTADAAWSHLTEGRGIDPKRIIIFGKSLGGAPAVKLAVRVHAAGLITESTFTSIPDMCNSAYPFIPRFIVRNQMNTISRIGDVSGPKLFIHGSRDAVIPYWMGERLFEAAAEPKQFYKIDNAGHNDTYEVGGDTYIDTLRAFIETCR